ncbi:SMI1/KNR4 family protein [uncultured Clostridium sp.]|uniref:SMI1/KNR4 family protein n=1 Tax=uncultured Clostridium sp. TaxID=59620 RepID=UPI0028EF2DF2|nr:SMI1/KNR4 family protein [uncultured Clostridium sp.]
MKKENIVFEPICREIKNYANGIHKMNSGALKTDIEQAEKDLNLKLPNLYKEFLQIYNGGELFAIPAGTTIAKVKESSEEKKQGIGYINDAFDEKKRWPGMPNNFIIIADRCYGDCICMDIETITEDDAIFIEWDHEEGRVSKFWEGIIKWLEDEMRNGKSLVKYDGTEIDDGLF